MIPVANSEWRVFEYSHWLLAGFSLFRAQRSRARACVEGTDGVGTAVIVPNVLSDGGFIDGSGQLVGGVAVKNLAFTKQVGVVYTSNNWTTAQVGFGIFQKEYQPSPLPPRHRSNHGRSMLP
jgi:Carbohydrate/starch-binding module (family 21)